MIARFRPDYSYKDLIDSLFADYEKSEKDLTEWLQNNFKSKNIFYYYSSRVGLFALIKSLELQGKCVVSPAYNCIAVPDAVRFAKMRNQFADISLTDYNATPQSVEKAINNQTKIILATHQYGIPCDIEALKAISQKHNLLLVEDAAPALGAKIGKRPAGGFGEAAFISFQDTKSISAIEGGCLIVQNDKLAKKIEKSKLLHSVKDRIDFFKKGLIYKIATTPLLYKFVFEYWTRKSGAYTLREKSLKKIPEYYSSGMNIFSLSLIARQIKDLEKNIKKRNNIANIYLKKINPKKAGLPKIKSGITPSWARFPVRIKNREKFFKAMVKEGVDLAWTFNYTCPQEIGIDSKDFPNATEASETILNLPIYANLSLERADEITQCINKLEP